MGMPTLHADQERYGIEMLVRQILPFPGDNILADIDLLGNDIDGSIPEHVISRSMPLYLATGRPLALLDAKFTDSQPLDRLAMLALTSRPFRHHVMTGLKAGIANVRLLRAQSLQNNETEKANALRVIESMLKEEIADFQIAEHEEAPIPNNKPARKGSWVDDIIQRELRALDAHTG